MTSPRCWVWANTARPNQTKRSAQMRRERRPRTQLTVEPLEGRALLTPLFPHVTLNGSATLVNSGQTLQLTNATYQAGSAYLQDQQGLQSIVKFRTSFDFQITPDTNPNDPNIGLADGITFTCAENMRSQPASPAAAWATPELAPASPSNSTPTTTTARASAPPDSSSTATTHQRRPPTATGSTAPTPS